MSNYIVKKLQSTINGVKNRNSRIEWCRLALYRKFGLQLIILDKRINFMKHKKSNWFNTSWFCWKLLKNDLNFERVIYEK